MPKLLAIERQHFLERTPIREAHVKNVCLGDGEKGNTCSYLIKGPASNMVDQTDNFVLVWLCAKQLPKVMEVIEDRLKAGTMAAKGNYCSGPPEFFLNEEVLVVE